MLFVTSQPDQNVVTIFVAVFAIVFLLVIAVFVSFGFLWVKGLMSGAFVPLFSLLSMRLRGISPRMVMDVYIRLVRARVVVRTSLIQSHVLAGGDARRVADWLVAAKGAGTDPEWAKAAALDLAHGLRSLADVPGNDRSEVFRRIAKA